MKKIYSPKDVLLCVLADYVNTECENYDSVVSAKFIDETGTVELEILSEEKAEEIRDKYKEEKVLN